MHPLISWDASAIFEIDDDNLNDFDHQYMHDAAVWYSQDRTNSTVAFSYTSKNIL